MMFYDAGLRRGIDVSRVVLEILREQLHYYVVLLFGQRTGEREESCAVLDCCVCMVPSCWHEGRAQGCRDRVVHDAHNARRRK